MSDEKEEVERDDEEPIAGASEPVPGQTGGGPDPEPGQTGGGPE